MQPYAAVLMVSKKQVPYYNDDLFAELNGEPFVFIGALIVFFPHFP